jgi:hypothetical protein
MRLNRTVAPPRRPWWRATSIVTGGLATLVAAGWASGCSVIYDLSTAQCSSNADCDALGGVFQGLECIENVCQTPTSGCNDNAQCMDEQSAGTEPWICRNRECIPLLSTECPTILPQIGDKWNEHLRSDSEPVILAGTGLVGGSTNYDIFLKNYDLALTEVNRKVGGLANGMRPLIMIGCQAGFDSDEERDRMMTHLADRVKVPGLIAAMSAEDMQRAFTDKGKPANMFFMSPVDSDPTLSSLMNNGLLWYIGPSPEIIARAYAPLLTRTLAHLTATAALTGVARVATVVTANNRSATNTIATIRGEPAAYGIAFNEGASVFENTETGNYLGLSINAGESSVEQVGRLLTFKPHVVISAASEGLLSNVIPAVESGWADAAGGQARPFYILSYLNYNSPGLADLLASNPTLGRRMVGVNGASATNTANYNAYRNSWNTEFPDEMGVEGYENFYDAAYYLIYAAAAGQFVSGDGQDLRRGMTRLLQGPEYNVGERQIPDALQALAVPSATIQLNGTLGPPNFNPLDGTRLSDGSVWCIDTSSVTHADVLRYVAGATPEAATLTGTFPTECIPDF